MKVREPLDVRAIRTSTGMTQGEFAALLGVSASLVQSWEQERREPAGAALKLLLALERDPAAVIQLFGGVA